MSRASLLSSLQNLFMEVLNETSLKIGATEDFQAHCETLAGIQAQLGKKLMPLVGAYRTEASKKPQPPKPNRVLHIPSAAALKPHQAPPRPTPPKPDLFLEEEETAIAIALAYSLETSTRAGPPNSQRTTNYEAKYATSMRVTSNGSPDVSHIPSRPIRFEQFNETSNRYTSVQSSQPKDCLDYIDPVETLRSPKPSAPAVPECSICQASVKPGDPEHTITSCCHHFHQECLNGWITAAEAANRERGRTRPVGCPICRENL